MVPLDSNDIKVEIEYNENLTDISYQIEIKEFKPEPDFDQEESIVDDPDVKDIVVKHEIEPNHDQDSNQEDPLGGC